MSTMIASESFVRRIHSEYVENPDLRLTRWQFQRLWNLDSDECEMVLERLVRTMFLEEASDGTFVRRVR
jgi:hypothetical protein